jgi:hypothetical protein
LLVYFSSLLQMHGPRNKKKIWYEFALFWNVIYNSAGAIPSPKLFWILEQNEQCGLYDYSGKGIEIIFEKNLFKIF